MRFPANSRTALDLRYNGKSFTYSKCAANDDRHEPDTGASKLQFHVISFALLFKSHFEHMRNETCCFCLVIIVEYMESPMNFQRTDIIAVKAIQKEYFHQ